LAGCASQPDPQVEAARQAQDELDARSGGLRVTVSSAVSDGRYLRFAGRVENRFPQAVGGIRYTIRIIVPGTPPRVAETFHREARTSLGPGEDKILRLEIENPIHASGATWGYDIQAEPVRLGDEDVPPPPGWQ
jgi:hypothetical protein